MREMKDSGVEWIGKIPINHNIIRNKYSLKYIKGKIPDNLNTEGIGLPYIGASELDCENAVYVNYTTDNLPCCNNSDVLILWDGARAGVIGTNHKGVISSTIVNVIPDKSIDKHFLFWYIKGFENYLLHCVNGTTIPHMNKKYIEDIQMIDWSLAEQKEICDYLDIKCKRIDTIIARQQQIIGKLKEYKLSVITETVTKGLDHDVEMKDSGIEFIGKIPSAWKICRLRNIGNPQNGISKGGEYFGKGYPFVSYGDIYRNYTLPETVSGLVDTTNEERTQYSVEKGDIFFTRTSETIEEVGFSCVCEKTIPDATFAGFVIRVRPFSDALDTKYAKYYFRSNHHRFYLVKEMNLVTRASLSQDLLKSMPVLIPPKSEQIKIAAYLDRKCTAIEDAIIKKQKIIDKLTSYKKSLIYEIVTGKKDVMN